MQYYIPQVAGQLLLPVIVAASVALLHYLPHSMPESPGQTLYATLSESLYVVLFIYARYKSPHDIMTAKVNVK